MTYDEMRQTVFDELHIDPGNYKHSEISLIPIKRINWPKFIILDFIMESKYRSRQIMKGVTFKLQ